MSIRSSWESIKKYAKHHKFHFFVLMMLCIFGIAQIGQSIMSGSIYGVVTLNKKEFDRFVVESAENREKDRAYFLDAIEKEGARLTEVINKTEMELNSKIDILDSAIKPEKKRRMLIVKVRNAITENTDTKLNIRDLNNIAIAVIDYSWQYNLSIAKVLAQMKQESEFEIKAKSRAKADGLMQIIPETWEYIVMKEFDGKRANVHNVYHNIKAGCFYMAEQLHKFHSYDQALMAYNWGPHHVREWLADGAVEENMPKETRLYLKLINRNIKIFEAYGLE